MQRAEAIEILKEYAPELTEQQLASRIDRHSISRVIGGVTVALYDPYAAAAAYVLSPMAVKSRSQGDVSETYADPVTVAQYLEQLSAQLRANWPIADGDKAGDLDLSLDIRGWGF